MDTGEKPKLTQNVKITKRKDTILRYKEEFLEYGFVEVEKDGVPRPRCVACFRILSNRSLVARRLRSHLATKHPMLIDKGRRFFLRLLDDRERRRIRDELKRRLSARTALPRACRLCLQAVRGGTPEPTLLREIGEWASTAMPLEDGLPTAVCQSCRKSAELQAAFRRRTVECDSLLKRYLEARSHRAPSKKAASPPTDKKKFTRRFKENFLNYGFKETHTQNESYAECVTCRHRLANSSMTRPRIMSHFVGKHPTLQGKDADFFRTLITDKTKETMKLRIKNVNPPPFFDGEGEEDWPDAAQMCRLCLAETLAAPLEPFFANQIRECTGVVVPTEGTPPTRLCPNCRRELFCVHTFRTRCRESDRMLQDHMRGEIAIKSEPIIKIEPKTEITEFEIELDYIKKEQE